MTRKSPIISALSVAALALVLMPGQAGADDAVVDGPVYEVDEEDLANTIAEIEAATGQTALGGVLGESAVVGQIPDDWNGDLVIYAHGYRGEGTELTVDPPPAYEYLVEEGYAWAASSYRRNSYDPGVGVLDTKILTRRMQNLLRGQGGVDKTYLVGVSMGGHVTASAIEQFPDLYDGALPACGVIGDVELFDYFLDYNVGSAAIGGIAPDFEYPDENWLSTTVPSIKQALSTEPDGAWGGGFPQIFGAPSPLTEAGQSFKDFVEIGSGGERVTYDVAWTFWHGLASPTGDFFFGLGEGDGTIANQPGRVSQNTDTSYAEEYGFDIDDSVVRLDADPRWRKPSGSKPAPIISGTPSIPVLAIHTTGDLFVPIEMAQIYAQEVRDNGLDDLLVQRSMRDVGHCTFTTEEWIQSYDDLFNWVENGVKPAGEDLIGDISSPTLGCDYTAGDGGSGFRQYLEPCSTD